MPTSFALPKPVYLVDLKSADLSIDGLVARVFMLPWTRVQGPDPFVHIPRRPHPRPRFVLPSTFKCTVFAERAASLRGRLGKANGLVKSHDDVAWVPRRVPIRSVGLNIRRTTQQRVSVPATYHHFKTPAGIFRDVTWPSALA